MNESSNPESDSKNEEFTFARINELMSLEKEHITYLEEIRLLRYVKDIQLNTLTYPEDAGKRLAKRLELLDDYLFKHRNDFTKISTSSIKKESSLFDHISTNKVGFVIPKL